MLIAFYGTLRPGEENHYVVRSIPGQWREGTVRGWTYDITWGPADGYPGISLDPDGPEVTVTVLDSAVLDQHLEVIDTFEGPGYRRVVTSVLLDDGQTADAFLYETDPEA